MNADRTFARRPLTASEYVRELYNSSDNVAILVRNRSTGHTVQTIAKAEAVANPDFQQWLSHQSASSGITFREQSKIWLEQSQNRKREVIGKSYAVTIQGALDKWILPAIGDIPLSDVDNLAVKPLIDKMCASGLSPRTVNKYIEHVKQIVASLLKPNGEPVHTRTWNAEVMDLPEVKHSEQKRPSLKADAVTKLIRESSGQEQALYVLLAATGLKPSIRVMHETGFRLSALDGLLQRPEGETDRECTIQRPAHHFAREPVENHRQVGKFRLQPNVGDVRYPKLIDPG